MKMRWTFYGKFLYNLHSVIMHFFNASVLGADPS